MSATHSAPQQAPSETGIDNAGPQEWVLQPTIELCSTAADVTLVLGEERQPVRASVAALRMASPMWKAMFSDRWAESGASEFAFPEDEVEAMLLVLRIAHLRFHEIPKKNGLSFQLMLDLAVVCDKYDLVHLVRPFVNLHCWAQPYFYPQYVGPGYPAWLFIAWTFGYAESFDQLARHLALNTRVMKSARKPEEWEYTTTLNRENVQTVLPPGIFESILQVRHDALAAGLKGMYKILDDAIKDTKCLARVPVEGHIPEPIDASKCRAVILGTLLPQIISNSLYPSRILAEDLSWSVGNLLKVIEAIKPDTHKSYDFHKMVGYTPRTPYGHIINDRKTKIEKFKEHGLISHEPCGALLDFASAIRKVVGTMPSPTLDSHWRHMAEQAKK